MFNNLTDKLNSALKVLKGHGKITEINVAETLKEVRRALLEADVNFKTAKEFTANVKLKALGQNVLTTINPGQLMIKIVKDELANLMGGNSTGINLSNNLTIISPEVGPCNCNGDTSGSLILTFKPEFTATPCAHNKISLSAKDNQK